MSEQRKKEERGWKSPFEIYYGRKSREFLNDAKAVKISTLTLFPLQSEYLEQTKQTEDWKNASEKIDERMAKLMEEKRARKNIYKTYNPGENAFVRIGKKKRKIH